MCKGVRGREKTFSEVEDDVVKRGRENAALCCTKRAATEVVYATLDLR